MLSRFSHVQLFVTLRTIAQQAPLSMGFPRQEYWNGLLCPTSGDLPDPGIEPTSLALAGRFFTTESSPILRYKIYTYILYTAIYKIDSQWEFAV